MSPLQAIFIVCLAASQIQGVPRGSKPVPRIVGGDDADIQDFPYQTALFLDGELVCQGSIVGPSWVLTAGHCFFDRNEATRLQGSWSVRVGSSQLSSGGQVVSVAEVNLYDPFDWFSTDLALLKLESSLEYGPSVQAVRLPEKGRELKSDEPAIVTGWGSTIVYLEQSEQLQKVELNVVLTEDCKISYGKAIISDTTFCAQYAPGGKGICAYDSGAPLVANGTLIGVGEFTLECGNFIGIPGGAFANVALYRDWITSVIGLWVLQGSKPVPRIVGGDDAGIQDFPYQAALVLDGELECQAYSGEFVVLRALASKLAGPCVLFQVASQINNLYIIAISICAKHIKLGSLNSLPHDYHRTDHFSCLLDRVINSSLPHGFKPGPRIVCGEGADIQDYPYQAAVLLDGEYACQASITSSSWVIGVSHCFYDIDGVRLQGNWSVRVGSSQPSFGGQVLQLSEVNFFEPYQKFLDDLALLKLENPLKYGPSIQVVKLPERDRELKSDEPAVATGWGCTADYSFHLADQLQQVTFSIVLSEDCQSSYGKDLVSDTMFCAQSAGKGLCSDDGGAPLVSNGTLLGVGEFSLACDQVVRLPGDAFGNVVLYRDWIATVSGL
ncbi:transmembrane protease serine 9-like [Cylas formicarius]|uniref:transmembrane protease serine 9-like n=1 Tax=Cylas formicarius TaxID=197179 RepID=UPI00295871D5|nr:transmembrane protease serine 9-like [Cylas formicarius]